MKSALIALLLVLGLATPAHAAEFQVSSTSWTSKARGWVLGTDGKDPVLLRTVDGGSSWQRVATPPVKVPSGDARLRVFFANEITGLVTDGSRLFVTRTGGTTWQQVFLVTPQEPTIGAIAADTQQFLVIVATPGGTALYSLPLLRGGALNPVPGVSMRGAADGDIATLGWRSYVVLSRVHEEVRYWVNGRLGWQEGKSPCDVDSSTRLSAAQDSVFALCSWNPGQGFMFKELFQAPVDGEFSSVGRAPDEGITIDLAAVSSATVVVSAIGIGAGWLHRGEKGAWSTPFVQEGPPLFDLAFTDEFYGAVVRGGPGWEAAELYRTSDGGVSWTRMTPY